MGREGMVLIVEDDATSKEILKAQLDDAYEVIEAGNGQEALEAITRNDDRLSVIILDLYMPVMNGYEVMQVIAGNEKWRNIPVVIVTSENSPSSDQKLVDLGACLIIHKPIKVGILKKQILNIIERVEQQKILWQEHMLQTALMNRSTHTFLCTYHFAGQSMDMGENYQEFVPKEFAAVFDTYPFQLEDYVLPQDLERVTQFFDIKNKKRAYEELQVKLRIDSVHYEWFKIAIMINFDAQRNLDNAILLFTNVEYEVEVKEKLTFMAVNDMLTRIPNMRTFADDVQGMFRKYPDENFFMITVDIEQFRLVNKLFGYSEGDNVLRYFATKIQEIIEAFPKGVYCRMASDIFYACFSENEDIDKFIQTLQTDMHNYPITFDLKLCFGIYKITDRFEDVETMIEHSAYARMEGKKNPIHRIQYYDEGMQKKEYFESVVISEMEAALENGQFEVYLQPKCNLFTHKVVGAEALIRWKNPEKGYLSPGIFIPIFEQNGFVTELDYYVYEVVCQTLRKWLDDGIKPFPISVNVSRCDLYSPNTIKRILNIVEEYRIPHELIEFEITESAFVLETALISDFTSKLREKGFRVLIDDFGSGYSSLNSLKDIMVDVLKIDIKFLPVKEGEVKAPIILSAVIDMAQKLGLDIIAEGVETQEQKGLLETLGCENVQGFYYYRPMPIAEFEKLIVGQEE